MGYAGKAKIGNLGKSILGKYSRMWKILGSNFFKKSKYRLLNSFHDGKCRQIVRISQEFNLNPS